MAENGLVGDIPPNADEQIENLPPEGKLFPVAEEGSEAELDWDVSSASSDYSSGDDDGASVLFHSGNYAVYDSSDEEEVIAAARVGLAESQQETLNLTALALEGMLRTINSFGLGEIRALEVDELIRVTTGFQRILEHLAADEERAKDEGLKLLREKVYYALEAAKLRLEAFMVKSEEARHQSAPEQSYSAEQIITQVAQWFVQQAEQAKLSIMQADSEDQEAKVAINADLINFLPELTEENKRAAERAIDAHYAVGSIRMNVWFEARIRAINELKRVG